jgi:hypothetical protein
LTPVGRLSPEALVARARLRQAIAAEVIAWCRDYPNSDAFGRLLALDLHEAHARHARELGYHEIAEKAEARYERARTRT